MLESTRIMSSVLPHKQNRNRLNGYHRSGDLKRDKPCVVLIIQTLIAQSVNKRLPQG